MKRAGWRLAFLTILLMTAPARARFQPLDAVPFPAPRPVFPGDLPDIPFPPLPPRRPGDLVPPPPPQVLVPAPPSADSEAVCDALMLSGKVLGTRIPPVAGPNGCGIADPVALVAIKSATGATIDIAPTIHIRCELAAALADWVRDDLLTITAGSGTLRRIVTADAYNCRGRDNIAGAKLSEHGKGNAVDLTALAFADGKLLTLAAKDAGPAVAAIKASVCQRFMTVLGPGSDSYHESHIHLDLEFRRNGAHLCEWNLPASAVPSPTP